MSAMKTLMQTSIVWMDGAWRARIIFSWNSSWTPVGVPVSWLRFGHSCFDVWILLTIQIMRECPFKNKIRLWPLWKLCGFSDAPLTGFLSSSLKATDHFLRYRKDFNPSPSKVRKKTDLVILWWKFSFNFSSNFLRIRTRRILWKNTRTDRLSPATFTQYSAKWSTTVLERIFTLWSSDVCHFILTAAISFCGSWRANLLGWKRLQLWVLNSWNRNLKILFYG